MRLEAADSAGRLSFKGLRYAAKAELELVVPPATRAVRILDAKARADRAVTTEVGRVLIGR